jgi:hypothetical protein
MEFTHVYPHSFWQGREDRLGAIGREVVAEVFTSLVHDDIQRFAGFEAAQRCWAVGEFR